MRAEESARATLEDMLEDMKSQEAAYQPTVFWATASKSIIADLRTFGFTGFRSLSSSLNFFVPTYGVPGNGMTQIEVEDLERTMLETNERGSKKHVAFMKMLNGEFWAFSDYRVCLSGDVGDVLPEIGSLSESTIGNPLEHFCFDGRWFSRSFLNYLQGIVFLKRHVNCMQVSTVLEIGGGYGTLGEILFKAGHYAYVNVDIPPTAAVATYYLKSIAGQSLIGYEETKHMNPIAVPSKGTQMVICPWQLPRLEGLVDLFVNFISFQEMEPEIVRSYLNQIDRLKVRYVLLRNMREGKAKMSASVEYGVQNPVQGSDYDLFLRNYRLLATNVVPFGHKTVDGFHSELRLYERMQN
jgi:putative sugar O-methyltransferase